MTTEQGDFLGNTAQFPPDGLSTAPAAAALRIMRYCPETDELFDVSDRSQLPAFNLSCVNCNPSHAILCGTYLIIKGVLPCVNLQLIYLKQL